MGVVHYNIDMILKNRILVTTAVALIATVGCTSPSAKRNKRINTAAAGGISKAVLNLDIELDYARSEALFQISNLTGDQNASLEKLIESRLAIYRDLKDQKIGLDERFKITFDDNKERAEKIGQWKTGIGVGGLASGIAGTVLLAASPANAVWVAAFSGVAGGVAGINSVLDNNGYSREQIAALEATVARQYAVVSAKIKLSSLLSLAVEPSTTPVEWQTELQLQEGAIGELRALAFVLNIPTVPTTAPGDGDGDGE